MYCPFNYKTTIFCLDAYACLSKETTTGYRESNIGNVDQGCLHSRQWRVRAISCPLVNRPISTKKGAPLGSLETWTNGSRGFRFWCVDTPRQLTGCCEDHIRVHPGPLQFQTTHAKFPLSIRHVVNPLRHLYNEHTERNTIVARELNHRGNIGLRMLWLRETAKFCVPMIPLTLPNEYTISRKSTLTPLH